MPRQKTPRYIFILGGVISGLGKGVFTASLGKVLSWYGLNVNLVKIDPYLNVDAGTMRPTEHGEVWVTYDGGEIDQDLGIYERFLETPISKENNITSGKILHEVIQRERRGEFLGQTVQYIPHVTDFIEEYLNSLHRKSKADVTIVEVGGTVGDYEGQLFLHTVARMRQKYRSVVFLLGYLLLPPHIGELKTKPFQHALKDLGSVGITPDFLVVRSPVSPDSLRLSKLANVSGVKSSSIISIPDQDNIYKIPVKILKESGHIIRSSFRLLGMPYQKLRVKEVKHYEEFLRRIDRSNQKVRIAIVGKYVKAGQFTLEDSYVSVIESLKFAAWDQGIEIDIQWVDSTKISMDLSDRQVQESLRGAKGIIVPGGFGSTGVEGKLRLIKYARERGIPYLGLCYGMQLAIVEFARHVLKLSGANTTEIDPHTKYPVVDILPVQKKLMEESKYGGTMRLGEYKAYVKRGTIVYNVYSSRGRIRTDNHGTYVIERHRHRYEVNPHYHSRLQEGGLIFSGLSKSGNLVEFIELPGKRHPFFVATQAHPEFTSYPTDPNPLFWGFIRAVGSII